MFDFFTILQTHHCSIRFFIDCKYRNFPQLFKIANTAGAFIRPLHPVNSLRYFMRF